MSMRHINFDLALEFDDPKDRWLSEQILLFSMTLLAARDYQYLRDHPETPKCYDDEDCVYLVPEQLERRPSDAQIRALQQFLATQMRLTPDEIQHHVDLARGVEILRDVQRMREHGGGDCFPLTQKLIVRSRSTGCYELLTLGDLRFTYPYYEALSYSFTSRRWEFRSIVRFYDKGVLPVSKARLSNGTDLVSTDDHKYWTLDGSRREGFTLGQRTMGEYVRDFVDFKTGRMDRSIRSERCRILQASRIPALDAVRTAPAVAYLAGIYAAENATVLQYGDSVAQPAQPRRPVFLLGIVSDSRPKDTLRLHEHDESEEDCEHALPGLRYGTVRSAVPHGEAHVGCIEVEGNHNFVLADGTVVSNCDNWASRRAAECALAGADVRPRMTRREQGGRIIYHAICIWMCDGSQEDPSIIKGMGGRARAADRREECRQNVERYDNYWRDAKRIVAESGLSGMAREQRAWELKCKIDSLGLLPQSGIFKVGVARKQ